MTKSIHETDHDEVDLAITAQTTLDREGSDADHERDRSDANTRKIVEAVDKLTVATDRMGERLEQRVEDISKRVAEDLQNAHDEIVEATCRASSSETSIRQALADGLDTIIEQTSRTVGKEMNRVSEELGVRLEEIGGRVDDQLTKTDERMSEVAEGLQTRFEKQFEAADTWFEKLSERFEAIETAVKEAKDDIAAQQKLIDEKFESGMADVREHNEALRNEIREDLQSIRDQFSALTQRVDEIAARQEEIGSKDREQILKGQRQMVSDLAEGIALAQTTMEQRLDAFEKQARETEDQRQRSWDEWTRFQNERLERIAADSKDVAALGERLEREHTEMMQLFEQERERAAEAEAERKRDRARRINNSGVARYHSGDFEQARELFEKAVDLDNTFAEAFNNLGLSLTELGEHEDATVAFETAIELNPELGAGYNNLGYVLYLQENYEAAIEMYKEAIGNDHDTSSAYTNLGNAYQKLGETEKAVDAWRKAIEIDPANERAQHYLNRFAGGLTADPAADDQGEID